MKETRKELRGIRAPLAVLCALVATTLAGRAAIRGTSTDGTDLNFVGPGGQVVSVAGRLSQNAVLLGGDGRVRMELVLRADAREGVQAASVPTDLVVILDRSGSMQGEKIAYARAAIGELISRLGNEDRLALVAYSDAAYLPIPLSRATRAARQAWLDNVQRIEPQGGTNMSTGIDLAVATVQGSREAGRAARIILISDGLANQGDTSLEGLKSRVSRVTRWEHTLSTVGVGEDFNELLMSSLADAGTGNYYFLRETTELASVFSREFEATRETVASGLLVTMRPGPGVKVIEAAGYPLERDGSQVTFRPGSLFSGQERRIWVTLSVPSDRTGAYDLGTTSLSYSAGGERHSATLEGIPTVACVGDEDRFFASVDKDAWEQSVLREAYNRLQERVAVAVKEGRRDRAIEAIRTYRDRNTWMNRHIRSQAVGESLNDAEKLEAEVNGAFTGAGRALKQNRLSKERQAAGRDGRRTGSKKQ